MTGGDAQIIEMILAMSEELAILRSFVPDDLPYVDRLHLDAAAAAKERTDKAARACNVTVPSR